MIKLLPVFSFCFMPAKTPFNKSGSGQFENMAKPSEIERNEILVVNVSKKMFVICLINFILRENHSVQIVKKIKYSGSVRQKSATHVYQVLNIFVIVMDNSTRSTISTNP